MRCARAQNRLMAYHDGELSAAGNRKMEKHLAACTECAQLLARLVRADQAAGTAGIPPDVPGADDPYWASFTSRVLDRVEEDAATRIPVSEKRSRPLIPMAFPRLVPAASIALVVVISAGVLLKLDRVAPVPKAPLIRAEGVEDQGASTFANRLHQGFDGQEATEDRARGAQGVEEQGERRKAMDGVADLDGQKQETFRQGALDESAAAPKEALRDELEKKGAARAQLNLTVPGPETGKLTSSSAEVASVPAAHAETPPPVVVIPVPETEKVQKARASPKTAAMADEASVEPDQAVIPVPPAQVLKDTGRSGAEESARKARVVETPSPETAAAFEDRKEVSSDDLDTLGGSVIQAAKPTQPPRIDAYAPEGEGESRTVESTLPARSPAPSPVLSSTAGDSFQAALPGTSDTLTEANKSFSSVPSSYRVPMEQLEHARRLADVRKYWESEQILKDLISQKPPAPVYEEASILLVNVLSNQNRVIEAQQFLDEAKQQFPASDLVQQYRLGAPAPVQ